MEPCSGFAESISQASAGSCALAARACLGSNGLANVLGVERDGAVSTGNVGGPFGMKSSVYPEYLVLFHAARALGRPVKWTDERSEIFVWTVMAAITR